MAVTLRFRPVLFGDREQPAAVYYLAEEEDGRVSLRDFEFCWPVDAPLDAVTQDDLPDFYRDRNVAMTILPVREVTAATGYEAAKRLSAALEELYHAVVAAG